MRIQSITLSPPDKLARKVVTRSKARCTGKWPSWKTGRMTQWESLNERNAFILLDCDTRIKTYKEQPGVIHYEVAGRTFRHYPDVWALHQDREEFLEIKPARLAMDPEVQARTALMERDLPRFGYRYRLLLAEDLGLQPRLSNCLYLARYGRQPVHAHALERVRCMFSQYGQLSWGEIRSGALGAKGLTIACRLILEGRLSLDMNDALCPSTVLQWSEASRGGQ